MIEGWERIRAHIDLYRDDPDKGHDWAPYGKPTTALLLTATGRKTGARHTLPLIYRKVGADFVVVGSKAGAPTHPSWYLNLLANPDCHIQVGRATFKARARTAGGAERAALWPLMVEAFPQYADYQASTEREIPVVVLEPSAGP
jgi:deazaflavin-dependent oxidoreductase (nitroreductase family)